jgi:acetyl-CoA acetyltransferase family protein
MTTSHKRIQIRESASRKPVIIDGARTAFVKSFSAFEECDALELYSRTITGLIQKSQVDVNEIDEISCGVVVPQTKNGNVARDTIINLNLPSSIHGYTLNRACTSSLQTVADAARSIMAGHNQLVLAGGVECLSDVPIVYSKEARRFLVKLNKAKTAAARLMLLKDFSAAAWLPKPPSISEPLTGLTMGEHAEIMAKKNGITREEQDHFAVNSHQKALKAQESGVFKDEIIPVWAPPSFQACVDSDNLIRGDTTIEALGKLRPAFDKKYGTLTAGNSSALTDGAAACLVADMGFANEMGLSPKAIVKDVVFVGVNPHDQLLIGPALAIPMLLIRNNLNIKDIDLFEIHEAFAAQVLSCIKAMDSETFCTEQLGLTKAFGVIPEEKLNIHGGALAIGHPFGATGARLITTLTYALKRLDKQLGVIAICAQGGMAGAMLIERV